MLRCQLSLQILAVNYALKPQQGKTRSIHRRVDQLVDKTTGSWNTDLVKKIFYSQDSELVLGLNAPQESRSDFIAWQYENNGVFSVKSAYKLAYNLKNNVQVWPGSSSVSDSKRNLWKLIWNAPVPNKVRIFAWRTAADNLATKKNKKRRKLEVDATCNLCGCDDETSFHATVDCTKSRALRHEMRNYWDLPEENMFRFSGPDWLLIMLDGISNERSGLVLMLLWRCWHLRNDAVHEDGKSTITCSVSFLKRYIEELNLCSSTDGLGKGKGIVLNTGNKATTSVVCKPVIDIPGSNSPSIWTPPPKGWVKINCDASFDYVNSTGSIACICRDQRGKVVWARNEANIKCMDVAEAEAKACLLGLKSIHDYSSCSMVLESDSAIVVEAINKRNQGHARVWKTYDEINSLIERCDHVRVVKIGRESNKAANVLADFARLNAKNYFWMGHVPTVIAEIVVSEYVNLPIDAI